MGCELLTVPLFSPGRRDVSDRFQQPLVVEPGHPLKRCQFDGRLWSSRGRAPWDPAVSLAVVAIKHDLNPNVLRLWVIEHERLGLHDADVQTDEARSITASAPANWPLAVARTGG
jgi:hypothetical protein